MERRERMAWIELHQSLPSSRKTLRLKARLKLKTSQAVGHLCLIWLWALDNAPDGDLSAVSPGELAEVADFNSRRAGEFLEALIDAGFVDQAGERLALHDWGDYGGRYVELRRRNAERKRQSRARHSAVTGDGSGTAPPVPGQQDIREQNRTEQDKTEEKSRLSGAADGACGAREELADYLLGRGLLPEAYFGAEPALIRQAGTLTEELFRRFTDRRPTELDRARVFTALMEQSRRADGGLDCRLDGGRRELLCYAFEQAAGAGRGGCWSYIDGVLQRLRQRGIRDLAGAERFDLERED